MKRNGTVLLAMTVVAGLLLGCGATRRPNGTATIASVLAEQESDTLAVQDQTGGQAALDTTGARATAVDDGDADGETAGERPDGWAAETHSDDVDPDYEVVFPQDEVNRLDITIDPADWQAMLDDMTDIYGPQGQGGDRGDRQWRADRFPEGVPGAGEGQLPEGAPEAGEGLRPPFGERPDPGDLQPPEGQVAPGEDRPVPPFGGGPGGGGMPGDMARNPIYVPVTVEFEGDTWTYVGLRFKGNSSLRSGWQSGDVALPMRLDFDQFEDDYPETDDQRFFGFKQVTLGNNWSDPSYLREKVTADIFREAGVPAAETAFYAVYVDYGEGPTYFGLYTMTEVVDDTVIETQFEDDGGNVYKPSGSGATFAVGTFNEGDFDKQTNDEEADWTEILTLFDALHAATRETDPAAWREGLEAVFDVDGFLNWLAVNTVVQNWDTYGRMSHNYYLYHDPETDRLVWIPWDNNMALSAGMGGGRGEDLSLDLESVDEGWPLIRFLMDDEIYRARYVAYVEAVIHDAFEPTKMAATYRQLAELIAPYVTGEDAAAHSSFDRAVEDLVAHASARYDAAQDYLSTEP